MATPPLSVVPRSSTGDRGAAASDAEVVSTWQLFRRTVGGIDSHLASALQRRDTHTALSSEALAELASAPDRMLPMTVLADAIGLTSGGLTKLVDRLVQAGLVTRRHSVRDRRIVYALLTERGAAHEQRSTPAYAEALRAEFAALGPHGLDALREVCQRLEQGFDARRHGGTAINQPARGARERDVGG